MSPERLADFDADVLILFTYGRSLDEVVAAVPTLGRLKSTEAGRAFALSDEALNVASIMSLPYALDRLVPPVSAALDK